MSCSASFGSRCMLDHPDLARDGSRTGSVCGAADCWVVLDTFKKCLLYPLYRLAMSGLPALLKLREM